jgi:SGNH hydrolase-like domain, acetyltransferase AlgX
MESPSPRAADNKPELTEDECLRRGLIYTEVRRSIAVLLTLAFVGAALAVPISQGILEKADDQELLVLELFHRAPTRENLEQFETDIEQNSFAKAWVQPRLQLFLTKWLGKGNKKAVVADDGWLYYAPGITHIAGPGFLQASELARRERVAKADGEGIQADPRLAIDSFRRTLAARGIELLLLPIPDKSAVVPGPLHGRASSDAPVARNRDWQEFIAWSKQSGVSVLDVTPAAVSDAGEPRFLVQDTHWSPTWLADVAKQLALVVKSRVQLSERTAKLYHREAVQVERVGDLVDMLKLPADQELFRPLGVTIQQVKDADGQNWQESAESEVLLLGDSFTNIYSLEYMGWGAAAGLGPQLSAELGHTIDVLAQNDSGAYATRQLLMQEQRAGTDRLAGKKLVVWEFAARELSVGDWKVFDAVNQP